MKKGKRSSKKTTLILIIVIIVVALGVFGAAKLGFFSSKPTNNVVPNANLYSGQNPVTNTATHTQTNVPTTTSSEQIEITAQRLQNIFQKSEYFTKLPKNSAIYLHFWKGDGRTRAEKFFIGAGGQISIYAGQKYDVELGLGDYNIKRLEDSTDLCSTLTQIKNEQDLLAKLNNIFSIGKYLYIKSCVPF
jgi:hypothetical protein